MKVKSKITVMRLPPESSKVVLNKDLEEIRDTLSDAVVDIKEYLTIHDYNNGILCGTYVGKPVQPIVPTNSGIDVSKMRVERCRKVLVKLYKLTGLLPDNKV